MRLRIKILFIGLALLVLFFISLNIFAAVKGKYLLAKKLSEAFGREVSIGSLGLSFPINLNVKNIEVKGLGKIDRVYVGVGFYNIFNQTFILSVIKVVRPVVTMEKGLIKPGAESPVLPAPENTNTTPSSPPQGADKGKFAFPRFYLGRFIISDGTFNFLDKSVGTDGLLIKLAHLDLRVNNLNFSASGPYITSFQLKSKIPWQQGIDEGRIEAEGWLNLFKKDMQANLKIKDIDGISLYPYYSQWVDLEKARIQKAKLNFTSQIQGLNNDVTAQCHLELTDIVRRPRSPEEPQEKAGKITDVVLDIFRALNQGKIVLDFTIKTKMDRPEFGFGDIKMAFEDKLAQSKRTNGFQVDGALLLPAKLIQGTFKGATDITKAVIIGTINAGKEIGKTVEDTFKREPKEKKE